MSVRSFPGPSRAQTSKRSSWTVPCLHAAVPSTEWSARESLAAEAGAMGDIDLRQRGQDLPLGVTLRIISAPASFALPMVQRKLFKPAFLVRPARCPLMRPCLPTLQCKPCFAGGPAHLSQESVPFHAPDTALGQVHAAAHCARCLLRTRRPN